MKINKNTIQTCFSFLLLTTFYFLLTTTTYAQQVTLSISPPIVETLVKPGKSMLIGYTIQNLADPTAIIVKVRSFSPRGDYGEMLIDTELISPVRFSLDNTNIQLEQPILMKQRDTTQALVRIRIPEGTPEGDYYFTVLAETQPIAAIGGATASLAKASIGSTLLITVTKSGFVETKGRIALFDIIPNFTMKLFGKTYKIIESSSKVPVVLIVQNLGKNLIKPQGEVTLRNSWGEKTIFPLLSQNILSDSKRLVKSTEGVNTNPFHSFTISGYFIGPYTLSSRVHFGTDNTQLYATTSFIGVPIRFGIALLFILIISTIIIVGLKKRNSSTIT